MDDTFTPPPENLPGSHTSNYKVYTEVVEKHLAKFPDSLTGLSDLASDYVFWSPAAAYIYGELSDQIFTDYLTQYGQKVDFIYYKFQSQLFDKMTTKNFNKDWNYVLWFTRKEHWNSLVTHLCQSVMIDNVRQRVTKFAHQKLSIPDPLAIDRKNFATIKPIEVFHIAVQGSHRVVALDLDRYERFPETLPKLTFYDPDDRCKLIAASVFNEQRLPTLDE